MDLCLKKKKCQDINGRVVLKYSVVIRSAGREKPPLKTQHVIVRKPIALLQQRSADVPSIYPVLICMTRVKNLRKIGCKSCCICLLLTK